MVRVQQVADSDFAGILERLGPTEQKQVRRFLRMATVTHFQPRCNALRDEGDRLAHETPTRACSGCGKEFLAMRPWQKHCSPKCRVRVHRLAATAQGYYGA